MILPTVFPREMPKGNVTYNAMIWSITEFLLRLKDDGSTFNEVQKVSGVPKQCLKIIQNVSFYKNNQINKKLMVSFLVRKFKCDIFGDF